MKTIINGKKYDTDAAQLISSFERGESTEDLAYYEEGLYKKRTGEFFLYGRGGPASPYSTSISQNQVSGGRRIVPLRDADAREWIEVHCDADRYEAIFGSVPE